MQYEPAGIALKKVGWPVKGFDTAYRKKIIEFFAL